MNGDNAAAAAPVYAATVKLPEFWQHDPAPWFQHIEAQFHLRGITVDATKYYHVVAALDSSTTRRVMGFLRDPPADDKYAGLKTQLLRLYELSDAERAERLLSLNGLGDMKPTELMENMLALLGSGDTTFIFIQLFLRQLPSPVRTALATSPLVRTKDYRGLAEEADRILLASRQYTGAAVSAVSEAVSSPAPWLQLPSMDTAAAVAVRREQGPDRQRDDGLCYYHRRFGAKAKRCTPPCRFESQGNARAGAR